MSVLKYKLCLYLFFLPTFFALIAYFFEGDEGANIVFMISNLIGVVILINMISCKKIRNLAYLYCLYCLSCFLFYPQIEGSKMYISTTLYTMIILLFFSSESFSFVSNKIINVKLNKTIIIFIVMLVIGQLLTMDDPMSFVRLNYNSLEEDALEQKGFLISHAFGYYLATFVIYFAYKKNVKAMIILTLLCFFFTRRTNVLLCGFGWFYYIYGRYGFKIMIMSLGCAIILCISYLGASTYLGDFAFSLDPTDSDSAAFTSGRTRFWGSYIVYLQSGLMNIHEYLFGFGPASSRDFNEIYAGLKVWMHNDFFDVAYCLGFIGLILYIYVIAKAAKVLGCMFLIFILIAANINGFMLYQTYPIIFVFKIIRELQFAETKNQEKVLCYE